jgi:hypothetical protein
MRVDSPAAVSAAAARGIGHRFVAALAAKDAATLTALFGAQADFRGLTPGRLWEARTPGEVTEVILGAWFEPSDVIDRVEGVETGVVGDRYRLGYRLAVRNPDGRFTVEQQAFFEISDGKITWMRVLCSGFRPPAGHA